MIYLQERYTSKEEVLHGYPHNHEAEPARWGS